MTWTLDGIRNVTIEGRPGGTRCCDIKTNKTRPGGARHCVIKTNSARPGGSHFCVVKLVALSGTSCAQLLDERIFGLSIVAAVLSITIRGGTIYHKRILPVNDARRSKAVSSSPHECTGHINVQYTYLPCACCEPRGASEIV